VLQHELRPPRGAKRPRKRVGRGNASGQGTYAGKGMKGQQARAGSGPRPGFAGGVDHHSPVAKSRSVPSTMLPSVLLRKGRTGASLGMTTLFFLED